MWDHFSHPIWPISAPARTSGYKPLPIYNKINWLPAVKVWTKSTAHIFSGIQRHQQATKTQGKERCEQLLLPETIGWNSGEDAGILRRRMHGQVPKVGRCQVGWSMVEECPLPSRLGVWGSVMSCPSRVQGRAPSENGFWRILKATECSFLYLYDNISGEQFALASPYSKFWGRLAAPRDLRPC